MSKVKVQITAECIGCKARKVIGEQESKKLSQEMSTPMCDACGMPMVAIKAEVERS